MRTYEQMLRAAADAGFSPEPFEKVERLQELLAELDAHPYLRDRLVLKGGTALNLFWLDLPRLSVDIDLNYVGALDRDTMLAERPQVERAVEAVCGRQGLQVRRVPTDHAGGKWRLSYTTSSGRPGTLELDLNYLLRVPLWPVERRAATWDAGTGTITYPVLDAHEVAAGKLAALFARTAGRDLYDAVGLLQSGMLDPATLRVGFIAYGAMSRRDWREVSLADLNVDERELERQVLPMLRGNTRPGRDDLPGWAASLVERARELLGAVLPLSDREVEFLTGVNDEGQIRPELLTSDSVLQGILATHPALLWKTQNVRDRRLPG
jgi:predicted nucleotidyltransferase component of viral defense system